MKKLNLLVAMAAMMMVVFVSCEKDEIDLENSTMSSTEKRIVDFDASFTKKSTAMDNIHIDSLVWYAEATFNYKYGSPNLDYSNVITDSIFMNVSLTDAEIIEGTEAYSAYVTMNNFIATQYADYKAEHKHMIVMNVAVKERTNNSAVIVLYSTIGQVIEIPSELKSAMDPFQDYDWWHAYQVGRCNGYNETHPSTENAADQLERYIKTHHPDFEYLTNDRVFYVDILDPWDCNPVYWEGNNNNDPATSWMYPTIVYGPDWAEECLSPDAMYFLLDHMDEALFNRHDNFPTHHPFNIEVFAHGAVGKSYGEHGYEFSLGIRKYRTLFYEAIPSLMD